MFWGGGDLCYFDWYWVWNVDCVGWWGDFWNNYIVFWCVNWWVVGDCGFYWRLGGRCLVVGFYNECYVCGFWWDVFWFGWRLCGCISVLVVFYWWFGLVYLRGLFVYFLFFLILCDLWWGWVGCRWVISLCVWSWGVLLIVWWVCVGWVF